MATSNPFRRRLRSRTSPGIPLLLLAATVGAAGYYGFSSGGLALPLSRTEHGRFDQCGYITRNNCVVDGDTFVFAGEKSASPTSTRPKPAARNAQAKPHAATRPNAAFVSY